MATVQNRNFVGSYSANGLSTIVGLACLAGFLIDTLVLAFPPNIGAIEWRISFLQQVGDRSIILLFGLALLMYGTLDYRGLVKRLALFCLALGVAFTLSSALVIRDNLTFQRQALNTINSQASQIQSQIQQAQQNSAIAPDVTPEQLAQAAQQISSRATELKSNAKTGVLKTGISSVGNLLIVGIALIGLGRFGSRLPRG